MLIIKLTNKFSEEVQYMENRQESVAPDVNGKSKTQQSFLSNSRMTLRHWRII